MNFLFVSNDFSAFLAHRHWLAKSLLEKGHTVSLCTGGIEAGEQALMDERISLIASHLAPHRLEIGTDLKLIQQYKSLIQSVKPDIVHTFTAKPNLYMTLALLSLKRQSKHLPSLVMSFPGLGKIFEPSTEFRSKARRRLASSVLRRASRNLNCRATFENLRDRDYFIRENIFRDNQCVATFGAGINLDQFSPQETKPEKRVFLFASRLLKAKGIREFIKAANSVDTNGKDIEFWVSGSIDPTNPDCFDIEAESQNLGRVKYVGATAANAMPKLFARCEVVCLPTQLQEGFPRVLIEAAANGLALIASDQPSIRQILKHGKNGWVIDGFDFKSLQRAMQEAINDSALTSQYAEQSTKIARMLPVGEDQVFNVFNSVYESLHQPLEPFKA